MVRKKSQRKPFVRKPISPMEKLYDCPLCGQEKAYLVDRDIATSSARIRCQKCDELYATKITHLCQPIDIYCQWVSTPATKLIIDPNIRPHIPVHSH
ncbi:unnamed protein product, partial [Oppiella nova]